MQKYILAKEGANYKKDFIVYFQCTASVIEQKKGERTIWYVRVSKTNTGEEIYRENGNMLGFPYSKEEARRRCNEISNNPWKYLRMIMEQNKPDPFCND